MQYKDFVKANFHKLSSDMLAKDKMKEIGKMWRASGHAKAGSVAGGSVAGGRLHKRGKGVAGGGVAGGSAEGGGILSGILGSIGLGVDGAGVSGGKMKKVKKTKGKGVAGGTLLLGGKGGMQKLLHATPIASGVAGGNFADFMHGIGHHLLGKGVAGGAVAGGGAEGGGILSGLLGAIGLGVPDSIKLKHLKKMHVLEHKMHTTGKLTPAEHHKLKTYHVLHGGGFFDSLWSGVKKVGSFAADNIGSIVKAVPEIIKYAPQVMKMVGI